jgi:hypothetical protein
MKIAALSFFSANDAFSGRSAGAQSFHGQTTGQYDVRRQGERRRKPRICEAARISPMPRLTTGLAMQVIAQLENELSPAAGPDRIEVARTAYRRAVAASGAVFNFRA